MVERGVESLFGGSKRAGWDCSLVTETIGEPSRSCHGEGHVRQSGVPTTGLRNPTSLSSSLRRLGG
jgi:hypothetical protein